MLLGVYWINSNTSEDVHVPGLTQLRPRRRGGCRPWKAYPGCCGLVAKCWAPEIRLRPEFRSRVQRVRVAPATCSSARPLVNRTGQSEPARLLVQVDLVHRPITARAFTKLRCSNRGKRIGRPRTRLRRNRLSPRFGAMSLATDRSTRPVDSDVECSGKPLGSAAIRCMRRPAPRQSAGESDQRKFARERGDHGSTHGRYVRGRRDKGDSVAFSCVRATTAEWR